MFFDLNDLYVTFKFKMVTANTNKIDFYACELKYLKQHLFNGNLEIDYVIRQSRLQGIRNCV